MPLSTAQDAALKTAANELVVMVSALVADPDQHPLQAALNAMTAERDALKARIAAAVAKIDESAVADAAEDAGRKAARDALLGV